ncbi:MAG TPA: DNA-formamidopyrimidine glycosylase family protein [Segetibacter sp.]
MPEGPSIVILKELVESFKNKKIIAVDGNSKMDIQRIAGEEIIDFKSWGKHFLICFHNFAVRIHFMLFGSYRINEKKEAKPRLSLQFDSGEINFYACSVQFVEGNVNDIYDFRGDVMNDDWSEDFALFKLAHHPNLMACDALLDQNIFAGVGNIIKNEVLFRIRLHPETLIQNIPELVLHEMITEARNYSFDFLEWKKAFVLKKHWLAHTKTICPRCNIPFVKKYAGKTKRRTFFCTNCQVLYE